MLLNLLPLKVRSNIIDFKWHRMLFGWSRWYPNRLKGTQTLISVGRHEQLVILILKHVTSTCVQAKVCIGITEEELFHDLWDLIALTNLWLKHSSPLKKRSGWRIVIISVHALTDIHFSGAVSEAWVFTVYSQHAFHELAVENVRVWSDFRWAIIWGLLARFELLALVYYPLLALYVLEQMVCRLWYERYVIWKNLRILIIKRAQSTHTRSLFLSSVRSLEKFVDVVQNKVIFEHTDRMHRFIVNKIVDDFGFVVLFR